MSMLHHTILPLGLTELMQPIAEVIDAAPLDEGPLVRLLVALQVHPTIPPGPGRHPRATTLAIRMDEAVAIELFSKLRRLARSMDWQLPPEDETQA